LIQLEKHSLSWFSSLRAVLAFSTISDFNFSQFFFLAFRNFASHVGAGLRQIGSCVIVLVNCGRVLCFSLFFVWFRTTDFLALLSQFSQRFVGGSVIRHF